MPVLFSRGTKLVLAVVGLVLATVGGASVSSAKPTGPEVIILGSSSVNGALGILIEHSLKAEGYSVARRGKSSSGFSRPDFYDWPAEAKQMKDLSSAKAVIVYMGVNDGQSIWLRRAERAGKSKKDEWVYFQDTEAWEAKYSERVQTFVQQLCDMGAERVVVITPMDVVGSKLQKRMDRIRALQTEAAAKATCGIAVATAGDAAELASNPAARKELRVEDGAHATRVGAKKIWARMQKPLLATLPAPSTGITQQ